MVTGSCCDKLHLLSIHAILRSMDARPAGQHDDKTGHSATDVDCENSLAGLARILDSFRRALEDNKDKIEPLVRTAHRNFIFNKAGWLLHHTTPMHLIADTTSAEDIPPLLDRYYREHWGDVAVAFRRHLSDLNLDDEAHATFEEALSAHGNGLYRATVRVLLPEIERFARQHLMPTTRKSLASLTEIRKAMGELGWSEIQMAANGPAFLQFSAISHQVYEKTEQQGRFDEIAKSQVPNRHAALHGLISYSSHQSSLSALIMTEFMFKVMSYLRFQQPDQVGGALCST